MGLVRRRLALAALTWVAAGTVMLGARVPLPHALPASAPSHLLALSAHLPQRAVALPVLLYHRVDVVRSSLPAITQRLTVDPREFATEMEWLSRNGFHTVTPRLVFDVLEHGARLPPRPVLITFDDGYRDVLGKAAPVLHRLHMTASEFVITGRVSGPDPSFLTWPMLTRLQRLGVVIGSHTITHRDLTRLSSAELWRELSGSRAALERHLHHPVQWLAYPFGAEDRAVVAAALRAGYVLGFTTEGGEVQSGAAPLLLRREEVVDTTGVAGLAALLGH